MKRICWLLPSGRMHSTKRKQMTEEDAQLYAEILPGVIFFYV